MSSHKEQHTMEFKTIVHLTKNPLWSVRRPRKPFGVFKEQQCMCRGKSLATEHKAFMHSRKATEISQVGMPGEQSMMHSSHWQGPAASPLSRTTKPQGLQLISLFWFLWVHCLLTVPRERMRLPPPHTSELLFTFKFLFVLLLRSLLFKSFKASLRLLRDTKLYFWIAALVISSRWLTVR